MTVPLQITFRDLPSSSAVEAQIRERAENLERVFDRLTSCRVIVEGRHRPQRAGKVTHLCIELTLPGKTITVGRGAAEFEAHDDIFVRAPRGFRCRSRATRPSCAAPARRGQEPHTADRSIDARDSSSARVRGSRVKRPRRPWIPAVAGRPIQRGCMRH